MASLTKRKNGAYEIEITHGDNRQRIYLGKQTKKTAELCLSMVEQAIAANRAGQSIPQEVALWSARIDDNLHTKLMNAGVLQQRQRRTLGAFIKSYTDGRNWKPATVESFRYTAKLLLETFGSDTSIDKITADKAADFRTMLMQSGLAEATVAGIIKQTKTLFNEAKQRGIIGNSPFENVKSGSQVNKEREYFVTVDEIKTLLDECTNARQRLIIALWRYGGLRAKSEIAGLRWDEIDWAGNRFTVHSPKTEGKGKDKRTVPLFPELQEHFRNYWESLPEGTADGGLQRKKQRRLQVPILQTLTKVL